MKSWLIWPMVVAVLSGAAMAQDAGGGGDIVLPDIAPAQDDSGVAVPDVLPAPAMPRAPATASPEPLPPPDRDRAPETAPQAGEAQWIMPLAPAQANLPRAVQVGASLPSPGILRLTGETASAQLRMVLPQGAPPEMLVLTLQSSVNILPDTARLRLSVNGGAPIDVPLQNLRGFGAVEVSAPGLIAGENRLDLSVAQPHRIFCGPEASFGVWTEIDLHQSGVALAPSAIQPGPEGFAVAVQAQALRDGGVDLLADPATPPAVLRAVAATLADALGGTAPVSVRSFYLARPSALAAVAVIQSDAPRVSFRRGASGTLVMQVEYTADAVPNLTGLLPAAPAMAPRPLALLQAGQATRLADLAQGDIIGNTHYFRADLPFRLADDWLLLANQKGLLQLRYGFAEGLPQGAILLVKVNGTTVRLLPLDRDGGRVLPPLDIGFPTNLLHPGPNALSFEMIVPGDPPDMACAPRRADMLAILADSTLFVPASPRMQEAGAAVALRNLTRDGVGVAPEATDPTAAEAAGIVLSAMLAPVPNGNGQSRLTIVTLQDAALVPLAGLGLAASHLRDVLFEGPAIAFAESAAPAAPGSPASPAFRLIEEEAATAAPVMAPSLPQQVWSGLRDVFTSTGWFARQYDALVAAALPGSEQPLAAWLAARSGKALLLQPDAAAPGDLWLVLAPDADTPQVAKAIEDLRISGLATGEAALLDDDGEWQIWSAGRMPELLEPLGPDNIRAVIGNYASWSPLAFMLALLGLALLSTLPVMLYLVLTRRRGGAR